MCLPVFLTFSHFNTSPAACKTQRILSQERRRKVEFYNIRNQWHEISSIVFPFHPNISAGAHAQASEIEKCGTCDTFSSRSIDKKM